MLDQEEYLISYANLKSGLFKYQKNFLDKKSLEKFYHRTYYGIPQCLPAGIKYFNYSKAYYFKINKKYFSKKIFKTGNLNYIGNKNGIVLSRACQMAVFIKQKSPNGCFCQCYCMLKCIGLIVFFG